MNTKSQYIGWLFMSLIAVAACGPGTEGKKEQKVSYEEAKWKTPDFTHDSSKNKSVEAETLAIEGPGGGSVEMHEEVDSVATLRLETREQELSLGMTEETMGSSRLEERGRGPASIEETITKGNIAFYCPKKMLESTASNVSVIISKDSLEKVKQLLEDKIEAVAVTKSKKEVSEGIEGHKIDVYQKMKVELRFAEGEVEVITKPDNEFLLFDESVTEREWDWVIKPKKLGNLQLILVVSAYSEKNGSWIAIESPPRIFNISVKVDPRNYFVKLWSFLEDHPEWIFLQVFFPLIAFFAGKWQEKKKRARR